MNKNTQNNSNGKGRPSIKRQIEIRDTLRPYFEASTSARVTARKTGINEKTVQKYFKAWSYEVLVNKEKDFAKRCKVETERTIDSMDLEVLDILEDEKMVNSWLSKLSRAGDLRRYEKFMKIKLRLKEFKVNLMSKKLNIVNAPSFDTILEMQDYLDGKNNKKKSGEGDGTN